MPDQLEGLLDELEAAVVETPLAQLAIGVDMAADETNWGICVIGFPDGEVEARLELLLPQAKLNANGTRSPTLYCRPSRAALERVLAIANEAGCCASVAVDVPFGWPEEHHRFVARWSAAGRWQGTNALPERGDFERRWCDQALSHYEQRIKPLAVGGDTIAQAAFCWATHHVQLQTLLGEVDTGLTAGGAGLGGTATFETYPAAYVALNYPRWQDYKSKPEVRAGLLDAVLQEYELEVTRQRQHWVDRAINQAGSPDAFDALICAITAWDHLRWRRDPGRLVLTTPEVLLGVEPDDEGRSRVAREGWILVRTGGQVQADI